MKTLAHKYTYNKFFEVGRADPTIDDLEMVFRETGISVKEMAEYRKNTEPISLQHAVYEYPVELQTPAELFIPEIDDEGKIVKPVPTVSTQCEYCISYLCAFALCK